MGGNEKGVETIQSRLGKINDIILRAISRGIDINQLSLGELIHVEQEATDRDRTLYACAAQNPELLPQKQAKSNGAEALKAAAQRAANQTR